MNTSTTEITVTPAAAEPDVTAAVPAAAAASAAPAAAGELVGLLAEFETVGGVVAAARRVRAAGYRRWDVHSPFPIHGIEGAMGIRSTRLPWLVLAAGLFGLAGGVTLQWFVNTYDYPFLISGKPMWSLPANIPVAFETTVLCAALTTVFGMLGLNGLPRHHNPLFRHRRFRRVTNDRFFILIDAADAGFDAGAAEALLLSAGASAVERVED